MSTHLTLHAPHCNPLQTALDLELTQQLPRLAELGKQVVTRAVVGLLDLEYRFTKAALEKMASINFHSPGDDVVKECLAEQRKAMMDMLGLRTVPRSIAKDFELPSDISFFQKSTRTVGAFAFARCLFLLFLLCCQDFHTHTHTHTHTLSLSLSLSLSPSLEPSGTGSPSSS